VTEMKKTWRYLRRDMKRIDVTKESALGPTHSRSQTNRPLIRSLMFCDIVIMQLLYVINIAIIQQCHISYPGHPHAFRTPISTSYRSTFRIRSSNKLSTGCFIIIPISSSCHARSSLVAGATTHEFHTRTVSCFRDKESSSNE
jgi:hypothetical protein